MSVTTLSHVAEAEPRMGSEPVAVIGGGLLGLTLAYRLSQAGTPVELFEAADGAGGVMRATQLDGYQVDGFYHTILSSDHNLLSLIDEVGLGDQTFFNKTLNGFYADGKIYPVNTALDLLRFKPLRFIDRLRLGVGSQLCRLHSDWRKLDAVPVEDYLVRYCGRGAFENFWTHLLRCKYEDAFDQLPATAIWARIRRMSGTSKSRVQGSDKKLGWDLLGYLKGGYQALVDRLSERIIAAGGAIHTRTPVRGIVVEQGRVRGVARAEGFFEFNRVVSTVAYPILGRMLPDACSALRDRLLSQQYMGSICMLLVMKRRLSPYHCLYLLDPKIPFTGVIETTHYIDPAEVGGHHLVYLSKYFKPDSPLGQRPKAEVEAEFLDVFLKMFPDVQRSDIARTMFARERFVDPIRRVGEASSIPTVTGSGVDGLYLANNCQIYPRLPSGESVVEFADEVLQQVNGVSASSPVHAS